MWELGEHRALDFDRSPCHFPAPQEGRVRSAARGRDTACTEAGCPSLSPKSGRLRPLLRALASFEHRLAVLISLPQAGAGSTSLGWVRRSRVGHGFLLETRKPRRR
jgi:hypothetical protein